MLNLKGRWKDAIAVFVVSIAMKGNCNPREYDSRGDSDSERVVGSSGTYIGN